MDRRAFFRLGAAAGALLMSRSTEARAVDDAGPRARVASSSGGPGGQVPVVTPNGRTLPLRQVGGVKVGHLVAEPVDHEFLPGLRAVAWGYNGGTPGPTIEAIEGDRLRLYVSNRLPEPTSVHWHGVILPNGMDGVAGLNQPPIEPGETFVYEFTVRHPGTFMYHPHFDEMTQIAVGMMGMFVVHPRRPRSPRVQRDFALMTHEWHVEVGAKRPDPNEMTDFNVLTFNSKSFPATEPLLVGRGERVRIRIGNLSPIDNHPIHIHGLSFEITATDGGEIPASGRWPETTVLVPTGSVRVIELVPTEPGDWAMHCHMTHHLMTQMGHDIPVVLGADMRRVERRMRRVMPGYMTMGDTGMGGMGQMSMPVPENSAPMRGGDGPFGHIDMGGMFTVLKVRERPETADPAGWYDHPAGAVASEARPDAMRADGVEPPEPQTRTRR